MGPLEDALAEQRRRSDAMTAALRHARYAPDATAASDEVADAATAAPSDEADGVELGIDPPS